MKNFKDYNRISDLLLDIVAGDIIIGQYNYRNEVVFVGAFLGTESDIEIGYYSVLLPDCKNDEVYTQINYKIDKKYVPGKTFIKKFDIVDVIKPEDFFISHPLHLKFLLEILTEESHLYRRISKEYEKNPNMSHLIDAQKFNL